MEAAFALVVLVLAGATVAVFVKLRQANMRLAEVMSSGQSVDGRLEQLRKELGAAREDAAKKSKALEEARAEAKKKARREGKKMQREDENVADEISASNEANEEVTRLKQAISGLEQQVTHLMREADQKADAARAEAKQELEGQLNKAREEVSALQRTLDDLRESVRKKAEERPDIPGTSVDLKALPTEAVQELARYFRKAEEFERLYGVAQGRLQLAQERAQDLQRRYYAVCRELALLTGGGGAKTDEEARKAAESVVDKSDQASASVSSSAGASAPSSSEAAAPGEEGAPKKKRRRRRRKKKPGEAGMAADGGAEGAEDGDEGDDDSDDGDDGAAVEAAPRGAATEAAAPAAPEAAAPEAAAPEAAAPEAAAPEAAAPEAAASASEPSESREASDDVQAQAEPSSDEPRPTPEA